MADDTGVSKSLVADVERILTLSNQTLGLGPADPGKIALDLLSIPRAIEQVTLLLQTTGVQPDSKPRLLEIGSGYGVFVSVSRARYGLDAWGVEPDANSLGICRRVAVDLGVRAWRIARSGGECLPFPDNSFDLVFSTNVLEHVASPQRVFDEAIRVLRPGGQLQFVIPNYRSFWEGHYGLFWLPFLSKEFAKYYVSLFGRKPAYIDTLQFLTPRKVRDLLRRHRDIEVLDWGVSLFEKRLANAAFSPWGRLERILPLVRAIQTLRLLVPALWLARFCEWYNPIVLTLRKKAPPRLPDAD